MRHLCTLFLISIFSFTFFSCQNQTNVDSQEDTRAANKAFAEKWFTALNSSDWKEEVKPLMLDDGFIELHEAFRAAFPDYKASIQNVLVDGDMVVAHIKVKASHQGDFPFGEFKGVEPSGKTAEWDEVMSFNVENGKMGSSQGFFLMDALGRMNQLGIKCLPELETETE